MTKDTVESFKHAIGCLVFVLLVPGAPIFFPACDRFLRGEPVIKPEPTPRPIVHYRQNRDTYSGSEQESIDDYNQMKGEDAKEGAW